MERDKRTREKPNVHELLHRFAAEEEAFLDREFFAPALRGGVVNVRIGGAVCRVRISPADFEGWGIFQPLSHAEAELVREATLSERRDYLSLFPAVRLIVCRRFGRSWFASAASQGDTRVQLEGLAPLLLVEEVQLFDCVCTRYDGARFWFDEIDMRHDPGAAAYLRESLNNRLPPDQLNRKALTAEERAAYELNYWQIMRPQSEGDDESSRRDRRSRRGSAEDAEQEPLEFDPVQRLLRETLSHAGAQLIGYLERADSFRVSYSVGGRQYTSAVNKDDLTVQMAGICLSGEDRKFDLASLVGVLREGGDGELIYEVGGDYGMGEDEYWQVHPPRN